MFFAADDSTSGIFETVSHISTPLGLAGLALAVFFLVLLQLLRLKVFRRLTGLATNEILKLVIERLFVLALIAMFLGFTGYIVTLAQSDSPKAVLESPRADADCDSLDGANVPIVWIQDNFRGPCLKLATSVDDFRSHGFDDEASSLTVPAGWKVQLYEDAHFRGEALVRDGPVEIADLKRDGPHGVNWGDRISSVRVSRTASEPTLRRSSNPQPSTPTSTRREPVNP